LGTGSGFRLIETMLWSPGVGFYLIDGHLERLEASAAHFGFRFLMRDITASLDSAVAGAGAGDELRVRLLLSRDGSTEVTASPLKQTGTGRPPVTLSSVRVDSSDEFLYHKTTRRELFDRTVETCGELGLYDMVFTNERGEVTEGAWNNIVIERGGEKLTPPLESGLLPGVCRRALIECGEVREAVLTPSDVESAAAVFCCNSVRGMVEVEFKKS